MTEYIREAHLTPDELLSLEIGPNLDAIIRPIEIARALAAHAEVLTAYTEHSVEPIDDPETLVDQAVEGLRGILARDEVSLELIRSLQAFFQDELVMVAQQPIPEHSVVIEESVVLPKQNEDFPEEVLALLSTSGRNTPLHQRLAQVVPDQLRRKVFDMTPDQEAELFRLLLELCSTRSSQAETRVRRLIEALKDADIKEAAERTGGTAKGVELAFSRRTLLDMTQDPSFVQKIHHAMGKQAVINSPLRKSE